MREHGAQRRQVALIVSERIFAVGFEDVYRASRRERQYKFRVGGLAVDADDVLGRRSPCKVPSTHCRLRRIQ